MTDVDCLDLLAQELGFVLKSEQRKALELLLRERMFSVTYQQPYLSDVCSCNSVQRPTVVVISPGGGGGLLPYITYTGMYRPTGS